jgi:hypothetical protein
MQSEESGYSRSSARVLGTRTKISERVDVAWKALSLIVE